MEDLQDVAVVTALATGNGFTADFKFADESNDIENLHALAAIAMYCDFWIKDKLEEKPELLQALQGVV